MGIAVLIVVHCCLAAVAGDGFEDVRRQGALLESERRWQDAEAVYRAALDDPALVPANRYWILVSLAELAQRLGEFAAARRRLAEAERLIPDERGRVQWLNARAALHLVEGKLAAAGEDLTRALPAAGRVADKALLGGVLHNLASYELQTGRASLALPHQRQALALWTAAYGERHEYVMRAWISLSSIQGMLGDWMAAERSLRQALQVAETPEALANYAVVLDHLQRKKEARAIRRRIPATSVSNAIVDVQAQPRHQLHAVAK